MRDHEITSLILSRAPWLPAMAAQQSNANARAIPGCAAIAPAGEPLVQTGRAFSLAAAVQGRTVPFGPAEAEEVRNRMNSAGNQRFTIFPRL